MIAEVRQTVSGMRAEFLLLSREGTIGSACFPNNFLFGGSCSCSYRAESFVLQYHPNPPGHNLTRSAPDRRFVPYSILHSGAPYGQLFGRFSRDGFFSRYEYDCLSFGTTEYEMFEVGLGKEGIVYPIYCNIVLAAEIDKDGTVYNNLDCYRLYALDEASMLHAFLLCLYLDARSFANRGEMMKNSVNKTFYLTTNKKLKAKYDPAFKQRVASMP